MGKDYGRTLYLHRLGGHLHHYWMSQYGCFKVPPAPAIAFTHCSKISPVNSLTPQNKLW